MVRSSSVLRFGIGFVFSCLLLQEAASARAHWTELNIGPFYVDTDQDIGQARTVLAQLEQLRWVLGGLLESQDLPSVWPIRVLITNEKTNPIGFVSQTGVVPGRDQFVWQNGTYVLVLNPGRRLPLFQVAGILLDENTPRLPDEVESGLRQLFDTLEAHGSRVTWGGRPPHPDLAWARIQLFATKFEYGLSFHVFMAAVKNESSITVAEKNAFGKDPKLIDQEAAANLARGDWQPVPVSGRPLDPKRDFGEHVLDPAIAEAYLADAELSTNPKAAEAEYKSAIEAGGVAAALGYEGLAVVARLDHENPQPFLDEAIRAGSKSAPVYVASAESLDSEEALPLLKKAAKLNPLWGEPVFRQAELTGDVKKRVELLKKATALDPRQTEYWIQLARAQTTVGEATAAQGAWLHAENSAAPGTPRDRIHGMRMASERERLDAAEAARRREREAVHIADQRAQDSEAARIRAVEEKANHALDAAAGGEKPENPVPWMDTVPRKRLEGILVRVDCLNGPARLWIKDKQGATVQLFLKDPSDLGTACGPQAPARRVSIAYAAQADDHLHTAGTVVTIKLQ